MIDIIDDMYLLAGAPSALSAGCCAIAKGRVRVRYLSISEASHATWQPPNLSDLVGMDIMLASSVHVSRERRGPMEGDMRVTSQRTM